MKTTKTDPRIVFETRSDKDNGGRIEVAATVYCTMYVNEAKERLREHNREQEEGGDPVVAWDILLNYLADPGSLYSYLWDNGASDYNVEPCEYTDFCLERISWDGAA